jgi:hypothetical protein
MAHEQEMTSLQSLPAPDEALDQRWPVPHAIMFVTGVSVALWTVIIALTGWLIG